MVTYGKDVRLFVNGVELKQLKSVTWEFVPSSPTTCERHKNPVLYTNGYCDQCLDEEVCAACEGGRHERCRELGESTAPSCQCPCTAATDIHDVMRFERDTASPSCQEQYRGGSHGHCVMAAMALQQLEGGWLVSATVEGVSHWYNALPGGWFVDLTGDQFGRPAVQVSRKPIYPETRRRSDTDLNDETRARFKVFSARMCDCGPLLSGEGHQIGCPAYPYRERR